VTVELAKVVVERGEKIEEKWQKKTGQRWFFLNFDFPFPPPPAMKFK
jgi:hypothetical protein